MEEIVGELHQNPCFSFQWSIPDFFFLVKEKNGFTYESPDFVCGDTTWSLHIYLKNEFFSGTKDICLYLSKQRSKYINVTCTLDITDTYGNEYMQKEVSKIAFDDGQYHRQLIALSKSKVLEVRSKSAPEDVLTVFCTLSIDRCNKAAELENKGKSMAEYTVKNEKENPGEDGSKDDGKNAVINIRGIAKFLENFKDLYQSKENSDVILNVKDREIRAHKAILAAQSPVFRSMFKHDVVEKSSPWSQELRNEASWLGLKSSGVVHIPDCDPDAFQDFLSYLYYLDLEKMSTSNMIDLYSMAEKYDVEVLKTECAQFMEKELSVNTFCDVVALSLLHNESALLESTTKFFVKNMKEIIMSVKWQKFLSENPIAGNELYIKALYPSS